MNTRNKTLAVFLVATLPLLTGCGTAVGAIVGGALGAAGGAAIETVRGGNPARGAVYGGILGAAAGGYYGYQKDEEERRRQEAVAAAQAAAQTRAAGETRCTSREQWSSGKLVVHQVICDSSVHRSGFRGDPISAPAAPPTVIYKPATVERYPYGRAP